MSLHFEVVATEDCSLILEDNYDVVVFLNTTGDILNDAEQNKYLSPVAAKHIETLQRSNEQLVKLIGLRQKGQTRSTALSEEDKNSLFDLIQGDVIDEPTHN